MSRADFWCRVLGWLQVAGAVAVGAAIYAVWAFLFGWIDIPDESFLSFIKWVIIIIFALPPFPAGLFTVLFSDRVEQAQQGMREESSVVLRVLTALTGLWSAGVVGFVGISVPPVGFFSVLGIASVAIAIMGPDWTADLFAPSPGKGQGTA